MAGPWLHGLEATQEGPWRKWCATSRSGRKEEREETCVRHSVWAVRRWFGEQPEAWEDWRSGAREAWLPGWQEDVPVAWGEERREGVAEARRLFPPAPDRGEQILPRRAWFDFRR